MKNKFSVHLESTQFLAIEFVHQDLSPVFVIQVANQLRKNQEKGKRRYRPQLSLQSLVQFMGRTKIHPLSKKYFQNAFSLFPAETLFQQFFAITSEQSGHSQRLKNRDRI